MCKLYTKKEVIPYILTHKKYSITNQNSRMNKKLILLLVILFQVFAVTAQTITSPDKNIALHFQLTDSVPYYSIDYHGIPVINKSRLGLTLDKLPSLSGGFIVKDENQTSKDELWNPVLGEVKTIRNNYNELEVTLYQLSTDRHILIRFRVFNDGIGFRYEFPEQKNLNYFVIKEEETEFALNGDHKAWWIAGDYDTEEYQYTTSRLSEIPALFDHSYDGNASQTIVPMALQTPLMLESKSGIFINIHEAALIDYAGMNVELNPKTFVLKTHLTPDAQGKKGYIQTPMQSPWRTIVISNKAEDILASKLILNLNDPTNYSTTDWIKPTKFIGVWWEMIMGKSTWSYTDLDNVHLGITDYSKLKPNGRHAANNDHVKKYIDFASRNGIDAVLVEGWNEGWEDWFGKSKEFVFDFVTPYPDFDIKMLNEYAHSKGVKLIMHNETSSSVVNYERWMDTAFKLMNHYGYDAVKTGYVGNIIPRGEHHYSQWMIEHYLRVVKKAAQHKVMVDSHESVHPTGLSRTYPNWVAAEAARGTEYDAFGGNNPDHTTILPFTRLMGGPMDYTPGIFQTRLDYYFPGDKRFVKTTLVKQLALYVTMYSPLQMAADLIENYERFPDAFQFIKDVAVDWDDTKILKAYPGDYILIARKAKGKNEWFVGGITDENQRTLTIDFSFLDPSKKWIATIYEDGKDADYITNPQSYHIYQKVVNSKTRLNQKLAASGGVAISIREMK